MILHENTSPVNMQKVEEGHRASKQNRYCITRKICLHILGTLTDIHTGKSKKTITKMYKYGDNPICREQVVFSFIVSLAHSTDKGNAKRNIHVYMLAPKRY